MVISWRPIQISSGILEMHNQTKKMHQPKQGYCTKIQNWLPDYIYSLLHQFDQNCSHNSDSTLQFLMSATNDAFCHVVRCNEKKITMTILISTSIPDMFIFSKQF